jgi:hypothetical protein
MHELLWSEMYLFTHIHLMYISTLCISVHSFS